MTGVKWSAEEQERAQAILNNDARTVRNRGTTIQERIVSPQECRAWREYLRGTPRSADSVDTEYSTQTVVKHATGECHHDAHDVGVPLQRGEGGGWESCHMISAGTRPNGLEVYHTGVCRYFPDRVRRMPEDVSRQQWRECRECSGVVPEAKPVKRAGGD